VNMVEHQTEQNEHIALTLVQAAAQLGIKPATLRMRYKRGKVRGFKRGGRLFIELNSQGEQSPEQSEQPPEQVNGKSVSENGQYISKAFDFMVTDNARLNDRVDRLVTMLEREQVLRQQMQNQIEQLTDRLTLPSPEGQKSDVDDRLEATEQQFGLLKRAVVQLVAFLERGKR